MVGNQRKSSKSVVFKMKCEVTSKTTHEVLISKEISYKSYKKICSGEPKKVNLGIWGSWSEMQVVNNSLQVIRRDPLRFDPLRNIYGVFSSMSYDDEVLLAFFSIHNIEQNWLDCNFTSGSYDEDLGGWTGCIGKVW